MKNNRKIIFVVIIVIVLFAVIGWFVKKTNGKLVGEMAKTEEKYEKTGKLTNKSLIMTIDNVKVGYDEASVYIRELKDQYQTTFGDTIWSYDLGEGRTFADMAKDEVIDQISQLKIIGLMAPGLGIEITKEEKLEISENVKKYLNSVSDEFKVKHAVTEELMTKIYTDNLLASKVFEVTTNDVNTEVSEDESKQITIQQILIRTRGEDKNGNEIKLTEKEKKQALAKARKLLEQAKEQEDFYSFAEKYTQDIDVEYTFGKGEMPKAVEDAAFSLKTGELSGIIVSEDGYHIIYCVSDYDEVATDEVKETIIEERQNLAFEEAYATWSEKYEVDLNKEMWDQVTFLTKEDQTTDNETENSTK